MELCSKGCKRLSAILPGHTSAGCITQRDHRENNLYKNIIASLFVVAKKKLKMRICPSIGEWLNKLWYMLVLEYYCAEMNNLDYIILKVFVQTKPMKPKLKL